jgi:hypothetical protein
MIFGIDIDEGVIKIGSPPSPLPGIVESVRINDSLLIENADIQGRSGKVKVVQGWDDVAVSISLSLIDDGGGKTRWDMLKEITGVFKKVADNGKPELYAVAHPMIAAWGTKKLLLSSLESTESRTRRKISVSMDFIEHDSAVGIVQERQPATPAVSAKGGMPPNLAQFAADDKAKRYGQPDDAALVSDRQRGGLGKLEDRFG